MLLKKIMNRGRASAQNNTIINETGGGGGDNGTSTSTIAAGSQPVSQANLPPTGLHVTGNMGNTFGTFPNAQTNVPLGGNVGCGPLHHFKTSPIHNDFLITETVLGLGINGKVLECRSRSSGQKYALKVSL